MSGVVFVAAMTILTFSFGTPRESLVFNTKPISMDVSAFRVVDLHMQVEKDLGYKGGISVWRFECVAYAGRKASVYVSGRFSSLPFGGVEAGYVVYYSERIER